MFFERIELIQTWDTKPLPSRQFRAWLWHNTRDVYAAVRIAIGGLVCWLAPKLLRKSC